MTSDLPTPEPTKSPTERDVLDDAKPWANPCGRHDYGELTVGCTCPVGDPRPVVARLVAEIQRLRSAQGWDPSSPQWAVIRAAIAWRAQFEKPTDTKPPRMRALIEAVDALPHIGEPEPAGGSQAIPPFGDVIDMGWLSLPAEIQAEAERAASAGQERSEEQR